jgi:hypothetical protein
VVWARASQHQRLPQRFRSHDASSASVVTGMGELANSCTRLWVNAKLCIGVHAMHQASRNAKLCQRGSIHSQVGELLPLS